MFVLLTGLGALAQYAFGVANGLSYGLIAGLLVAPLVPVPGATCGVSSRREAP